MGNQHRHPEGFDWRNADGRARLRIYEDIRDVDNHLTSYHLKRIMSLKVSLGNHQQFHQYSNVGITHHNIEVFSNPHYLKALAVKVSTIFKDEFSFLKHRSQSVSHYLHTSCPSFYLIECDP